MENKVIIVTELKSLELNVGKYNIDFLHMGMRQNQNNYDYSNSKESKNINLKKLPDGVSSNPDMGFLTVHHSKMV